MSIHSFSVTASAASAVGYLAYSLRDASNSPSEVGIKVLKSLGIGLASYTAIHAGVWGKIGS